MNLESVIYLTNIVIGVILATLTTHYWREQRQSGVMQYWAAAAWILTAADVVFAARPILPYVVDRLVPTLGVTIGKSCCCWARSAQPALFHAGACLRPSSHCTPPG